MPTYQYACTECGTQMEVVQSFTDDALTVCPECEGRLRKVYSAVGIVFKGSGFYRTDSGSSGRPAAATGSGKGDGAKSDSASGSGSDSSSSSGDSASTSSSGSSDSGSTTSSGTTGSTSGTAKAASA
ncbi:FmdB family zinc ribbon protein [Nocardiopsis mangrovi]|uniref:FmdB family zinc ribbon protein n=1 Tax=Nocardiopsis mangrovi TaxID=1179818 RepID=A0ABV9DXR0_9ACTN